MRLARFGGLFAGKAIVMRLARFGGLFAGKAIVVRFLCYQQGSDYTGFTRITGYTGDSLEGKRAPTRTVRSTPIINYPYI